MIIQGILYYFDNMSHRVTNIKNEIMGGIPNYKSKGIRPLTAKIYYKVSYQNKTLGYPKENGFKTLK